MRDNLYIKLLEQNIKQIFSETLDLSPINTVTPFFVEREEDGKEEIFFTVKAESWLYSPLQGKTIDDKMPMGMKAYLEDDNLIIGFDLEPDIYLETEIIDSKIKEFLSVLKKQEVITLIVLDHITYNIVWLTNTYPFHKVKDQFQPLFDRYEV